MGPPKTQMGQTYILHVAASAGQNKAGEGRETPGQNKVIWFVGAFVVGGPLSAVIRCVLGRRAPGALGPLDPRYGVGGSKTKKYKILVYLVGPSLLLHHAFDDRSRDPEPGARARGQGPRDFWSGSGARGRGPGPGAGTRGPGPGFGARVLVSGPGVGARGLGPGAGARGRGPGPGAGPGPRAGARGRGPGPGAGGPGPRARGPGPRAKFSTNQIRIG